VQLTWRLASLNAALLPDIVYAPYDPPSVPVISIFDPTGAEQITSAAMTKLASGLYGYVYQTPSGGPLGTWSGYIDVTDASSVVSGSVDGPDLQKATPLFQLV